LSAATGGHQSTPHIQFSQISLGFTHWIFSLMFGGLTKGDLSVKNGFIRSTASFNPFSLKPEPA
jgi:hypothetical protein